MLLALMLVTLPNGFTPRPYQRAALDYFADGGKRAFTTWHRRAGKDLVAAHHGCMSSHLERGQYWHFFPTLTQAKRSLWEGYTKTGERIMEQVFPGFLNPKRRGSIVASTNETDLSVELKCGSLWRLMGSDRMEAVGAGPKGVVFSEFALCRPTTWNLVRPMLRESGGWAWFITTPRGPNHAKKLFDQATPESGWFRDTKTVLDTGLTYDSSKGAERLTPEEMMAQEAAEGMPPELIRQEYLCDWQAASVGSVWGDLLEQLEKRGGIADFSRSGDVFTSWDLGFTDATGVWFWRPRGDGVELVGHIEAHSQPLSFYFDRLDELAAAHGWRYVKHWLPHDARARTLATGRSIEDQFRERFGPGAYAIGPSLSLLDGIQAARWLLQREGTRFHVSTAEGIDALRSYRYGYDENAKAYTRKPVHDWSSHTADAFRGVAVVARASDVLTRRPEEAPRRPVAVAPSKAFTLEELFEDLEPVS